MGTKGALSRISSALASSVSVDVIRHDDTRLTGMGIPGPSDQNLVAWGYDPANATTGSLLVNGTVYLTKIVIPYAVTISKLYWHVSAAAVTPTSGQNFAGLYSSAGVRLAFTDVGTDTTFTGVKATSITGQALSGGAFCWVALLFNAATAPTVARSTAVGAFGNLVNVGLTAATYRFAVVNTSQTTLPASFTPSALSLPTFSTWVAVGV